MADSNTAKTFVLVPGAWLESWPGSRWPAFSSTAATRFLR